MASPSTSGTEEWLKSLEIPDDLDALIYGAFDGEITPGAQQEGKMEPNNVESTAAAKGESAPSELAYDLDQSCDLDFGWLSEKSDGNLQARLAAVETAVDAMSSRLEKLASLQN
ncbi:MAG: hypothetical protein MMC23_006298, partial [Stictis urceolatum]|nr:hypothetical protein [Stictis urceolata]